MQVITIQAAGEAARRGIVSPNNFKMSLWTQLNNWSEPYPLELNDFTLIYVIVWLNKFPGHRLSVDGCRLIVDIYKVLYCRQNHY